MFCPDLDSLFSIQQQPELLSVTKVSSLRRHCLKHFASASLSATTWTTQFDRVMSDVRDRAEFSLARVDDNRQLPSGFLVYFAADGRSENIHSEFLQRINNIFLLATLHRRESAMKTLVFVSLLALTVLHRGDAGQFHIISCHKYNFSCLSGVWSVRNCWLTQGWKGPRDRDKVVPIFFFFFSFVVHM